MGFQWVPIIAITFVFGGAIAITALVLKYRARKLEHDEIMKSIEMGHEIPEINIRRKYSYLSDMRLGVFFTAVGVGIFLAGSMLIEPEVKAFALIPILVGVGFIVMSFVLKSVAENEKNGNGGA